MKVDILAMKEAKPLIIEILYRHKVENQKILKIAEADISAIEINLSDVTPDDVLDWETFWSCINDPKRIQWLYNTRELALKMSLENQLALKIQQAEKEYEQERIKEQKRIQKEKSQLVNALKDLKVLCSSKYIAQLKKGAEIHPSWKVTRQYLPIPWQELPEFLNVEVTNGDWIFGCDRRIWQAAFYSAFICYSGKPFSIRAVDDWLQNKAGCKVSSCVKNVGIYGRLYPELVPADISSRLPSSWETLKAYFRHLQDLGMLDFLGPDRAYRGSKWFQVVSKEPKKSKNTSDSVPF